MQLEIERFDSEWKSSFNEYKSMNNVEPVHNT